MANATGKTYPYILEPAQPFPLDGIDPADFEYAGGFIQLRGDFTGVAVRLRRTSDNAEQDFGFKDRKVDEAELLTFEPTNDLRLVKIYDQVGTGVDWTQAVAGSQLLVSLAGVVIKSQNGIIGGRGIPAGPIEDCVSSTFTFPKNYTEYSAYFEASGAKLTGRGGTRSIVTTNGWRNQVEAIGSTQLQAIVHDTAGVALTIKVLTEVADPTNGVVAFSYADDDSGGLIFKNQDGQVTGSWTPGSRNTATTNGVHFNRRVSTEGAAQVYSIMMNTFAERTANEDRFKAVIGV